MANRWLHIASVRITGLDLQLAANNPEESLGCHAFNRLYYECRQLFDLTDHYIVFQRKGQFWLGIYCEQRNFQGSFFHHTYVTGSYEGYSQAVGA